MLNKVKNNNTNRPVSLLERELKLYKRALVKSIESFQKGNIDKTTHELHKKNLTILINEFTNVLNIINKN